MPTASGHTTAIRASQVIGTGVFTANGDEIGRIGDVILDKTSDKIMFAVIARAGALTAVDNFYPVAWSDLDYHEDRQGYVLPYGIEELEDDGVSAMFELIDDDGAKAR